MSLSVGQRMLAEIAACVAQQSRLLFLDEPTAALSVRESEELFAHLDQLNADPSVHGILIQAPLPKHLPESEVFNRVSPDKDVDGFGTQSIGRLVQELPGAFAACTPAGVIELLRRSGVETAGKHAVVVGRSLIVGKPAAFLLLAKGCDCTVTIPPIRPRPCRSTG